MRLLYYSIAAALLVSSCKQTDGQHNKVSNKDSIAPSVPLSDVDNNAEPSKKVEADKPVAKPADNPWLRTGKHKLTLQWISWDKPGSVTITQADGGWFTVKGEQNSDEGNDYLRIDGKAMPLSDKELLFDGNITYSIATINAGEPCVKSGRQTFLSTKGRKYWRLQNMLHCVEGTTDYVDIYF